MAERIDSDEVPFAYALEALTNMNRMIILIASVVICGVAIYFYAHYNGNSLAAGTTIGRISRPKNKREHCRSFATANRLAMFRDCHRAQRLSPK